MTMTTYKITYRFTGAVLFSRNCGSLKLCVEAAVKAKISLDGANLGGANLVGANLASAYLSGAYLGGANLDGADLSGALKIDPADIPVIPQIDAAIEAALDAGGTLNMGTWHGPKNAWCGTTHCRAGWAVHLAGEKGKALEDRVGVQMAATLIYHASRPGQPSPWFFDSDENALADIRKCAAEQRGGAR